MNDKSILDILEQDEPFKWQGENYNRHRTNSWKNIIVIDVLMNS